MFVCALCVVRVAFAGVELGFNPLEMPQVGAHTLRVLSPSVLELERITTKYPDPARVTEWDFVGAAFEANLPMAGEFAVTVNGQAVGVRGVGFKRRVLYAPVKQRDLRIANYLYLELAAPIAEGSQVVVINPSGRLWGQEMSFEAMTDWRRWSPAIHVNQVGYMPEHPKKAMVGYYLGSMGELNIPASGGFKVIESASGKVVFTGVLSLRPDKGYKYSPAPYQRVYEADFTAVTAPGEYQIVVPGLGASFPFLISEGTMAAFTRTYALGLYHQRCGSALEYPFTRHTHGLCHANPAEVPDASFQRTEQLLNEVSGDYRSEPRHTAPQLKSVDASLYPFVNKAPVNVRGGHHDAGDYSKYTINSAGLIHHLVFAADNFGGAGELDNLGLPESGDGKSDLLQEAKWEADYLARMQDEDGGFYFLVYPKERRYEDDVLPDAGDPQVVWPKNTAVTAAAVAALAEIGSSPRFKQQFPAESALYLEKAERGWRFLEAAIAKYGKDGAYQKLTHYGHEFMHDDELAWAAAAMFAATGDGAYHARLKEWFNPGTSSTRRWSWWKLYEGYGSAARTYAFAARSGRLSASSLDVAYLGRCQQEIIGAAEDHVRFASENSYGTSFPDQNKQYRSAGWYFSSERAFDITVGYQLDPKASYLEAIISNLNYEAGCNPVNVSFITGLGWKQQREIVHQHAQNDWQVLPPAGIPLGNIQPGFAYLYHYKQELGGLSFPADGAATAPYPYYDRWGDSFNTMTEFVVVDQARSLASLSFLMAQSAIKAQAWRAGAARIIDVPETVPAEQVVRAAVVVDGIDLSEARILWEARDQEPFIGPVFAFAPQVPGEQWIEVDVRLPDGRRFFARSKFEATTSNDLVANSYQPGAVAVGYDTVAVYHLDGDLSDATGRGGALTLAGNAALESSNLGWMQERAGMALRVFDLGDSASVELPAGSLLWDSNTASISVEAMVYAVGFKAFKRKPARILGLVQSWNASLELLEDPYAGLRAKGGTEWDISGAILAGSFGLRQWHHVQLTVHRTGYRLSVNGHTVASKASNELASWGNGPVTVQFGDFDGWVDEVVVRRTLYDVPSNEAPTVSLTSPASGTPVVQDAPVLLAADASDTDGRVLKVEFLVDNVKVGEDASAPFEALWANPQVGVRNVTACAIDDRGGMTVSSPVTISVGATSETCLAPTITPGSGSFQNSVVLTIATSTEGMRTHYTLDGSAPNLLSPLYVKPISLFRNTTVRARTFKQGLLPSDEATAVLEITVDPAAKVSFVGVDDSTQGDWKGKYGSEGYTVIGDRDNYATYAQVSPSGHTPYVWTADTAEARALERSDSASHIAGCWYSTTTFSADLRLNDGQAHRVALYFLDWDTTTRRQKIEVIDPVTGTVLDTKEVSAFSSGKYLIWDIKGHVQFRFSRLGGNNAVLMGMFFDAVPSASATQLRLAVPPVGRQAQLVIQGQPGEVHVVEASADFRSWTTIHTQTMESASVEFTDPESSSFPQRFYRTRRVN